MMRNTSNRLVAGICFYTLLVVVCAGAVSAKEKIVLWTTGSIYQKVFDILLPEFRKAYPDIDLEVQYNMQAPDKLLVAYAGGAAPDVVTQSTRNAPQFIDSGAFIPINYRAFGATSATDYARRYFPGVLSSLEYKGKVYFTPTEISNLGLIYNKTLLANAGMSKPATTWQEMLKQSSKLTRVEGDKLKQVGTHFFHNGIWAGLYWVSLLRQNGTDWTTENGMPNFSSPKAIEAVKVYAEFFRDQMKIPSDINFIKGNVGIFPTATYYYFNLTDEIDTGSAPYPVLEGRKPSITSYAWGLFVTSQAKNPELAWKVAEFFTNSKWGPIWLKEGGLVQPYYSSWLLQTIKEKPILAPFLSGLEFSQMEIAHTKFNDIQKALQTAEQSIVAGTLPVEQALYQVDQTLTPIFNVK
jgi:ABC-type glycerol-3-phosphate transport system substrate-binding protein